MDEYAVETDVAAGSRLSPPSDTEYGIRASALVGRSGDPLRVGSG